MSQPSSVSTPGAEVPAQKQRADVYTVMLIISFICIVTATILLYAELQRWAGNTSEAKTSAVWPVEQPGLPIASKVLIA